MVQMLFAVENFGLKKYEDRNKFRFITYVISLCCFTYGCSFIASNESKGKVTVNFE